MTETGPNADCEAAVRPHAEHLAAELVNLVERLASRDRVPWADCDSFGVGHRRWRLRREGSSRDLCVPWPPVYNVVYLRGGIEK